METDNNSLENLSEIEQIIKKNIIGNNESLIIDNFVNHYWQNAELVLNATDPLPQKVITEVTKGREIINIASTLDTPGAKMLMEHLTKIVSDSTKTFEKSYTRSLKNPNIPNTLKEDNTLDVSGFTNVLIIIIVTIILGLILAAIIINK